MREWAIQHQNGNVRTSQFIALAEQVSGQDLGAFFDEWLYQPGKPAGLADGAAASDALAAIGRLATGRGQLTGLVTHH
jgi:hypothetical protein